LIGALPEARGGPRGVLLGALRDELRERHGAL